MTLELVAVGVTALAPWIDIPNLAAMTRYDLKLLSFSA